MTTTKPAGKKKLRQSARVAWLTGLLLLLLVVGVVAHFGEGREFAQLLARARPLWLLAALGLQAGTYLCAAGVWQRALAHQGKAHSLGSLVPLGVAKTFMDQAVPSAGVSGTLLVARALRRRGVSNRNAVSTVLAGLVAYYLAYGIAVGSALVMLWLSGRVNRFLVTTTTAFAVLVAAVPAAILWISRRSRRGLPRWVHRIPALAQFLATVSGEASPVLRNRVFLVEATALQLALIVLDAATLAVSLLAVGATPEPIALFTAFTMASMVGTLSPIPGGLGTFDGTVIAMLRAFGTPIEPALAATVLLRGFMLLLPMAPGFWVARLEARRRR